MLSSALSPYSPPHDAEIATFHLEWIEVVASSLSTRCLLLLPFGGRWCRTIIHSQKETQSTFQHHLIFNRRKRKRKKQSGISFLELWKTAKSLKHRNAFKDKCLQQQVQLWQQVTRYKEKRLRMSTDRPCQCRNHCCTVVYSSSSSSNSQCHLTCIFNIKMQIATVNYK